MRKQDRNTLKGKTHEIVSRPILVFSIVKVLWQSPGGSEKGKGKRQWLPLGDWAAGMGAGEKAFPLHGGREGRKWCRAEKNARASVITQRPLQTKWTTQTEGEAPGTKNSQMTSYQRWIRHTGLEEMRPMHLMSPKPKNGCTAWIAAWENAWMSTHRDKT